MISPATKGLPISDAQAKGEYRALSGRYSRSEDLRGDLLVGGGAAVKARFRLEVTIRATVCGLFVIHQGARALGADCHWQKFTEIQGPYASRSSARAMARRLLRACLRIRGCAEAQRLDAFLLCVECCRTKCC